MKMRTTFTPSHSNLSRGRPSVRLGHCGARWPAAKRRLGKALDTENMIRALIQPFRAQGWGRFRWASWSPRAKSGSSAWRTWKLFSHNDRVPCERFSKVVRSSRSLKQRSSRRDSPLGADGKLELSDFASRPCDRSGTTLDRGTRRSKPTHSTIDLNG